MKKKFKELEEVLEKRTCKNEKILNELEEDVKKINQDEEISCCTVWCIDGNEHVLLPTVCKGNSSKGKTNVLHMVYLQSTRRL